MTYIKRKSDKQEKRTAKEFGGNTQIASGAIEGMKGDVRTGERIAGTFNDADFLIENKFTDAPSYKLSLATWNKIVKEALRDNLRTPMMQIDIQDLELVLIDGGTFNAFFNPTNLSVIQFGGKSATLQKENLSEILDVADAVVLDFYNIPVKLYVVQKDDFLRKLS